MNKFINEKVIIFLPTLTGGGAEETFVKLANYLNECEYDATLLVGTNKTSNIYEKKIINKIKVIDSSRIRYSFVQIFNYLKTVRPDVVISTLWYANIIIFLICKFLGIKTILREAGLDYRANKGILNYLKILSMKYVYNNSNKTVVISDYLKKDLTDNLSINPSRITQIYNPVKSYIEQSNLKKVDLDQYFPNANKETKYVVCASRLDKIKGVDYLIESFKNLRNENVKLLILGDGIEKENYKDLINKHQLEGNVYLCGWVENVYDFIFSCDAYVSPSRFEGLGNAYIAAQLLNKKCLSSNIDASVEINNIFNAGMVFNFNKNNLSEQLINLLSSPKTEILNVNLFSEDYCFDKYKEILETI